MSQMQIGAVGIAWYRKEDWPALQRLFTDARVLPATYEEWLRKADGLAAQITAQGGIAEKVIIDPREFGEWCRGHGLRADAQARMRFGNEFVARKYLKQS